MPAKKATPAKASPSAMKSKGARAAAAKPQEVAPPVTSGAGTSPARPPFRRLPAALNFAGVGRNDICPCGSGKRFKNCHGH